MKAMILAVALAVGLSGCAISMKADWTPAAKKSYAEFKAAQKKSLEEQAKQDAFCKANPSNFDCVGAAALRRP